jgi:hypothetical protein
LQEAKYNFVITSLRCSFRKTRLLNIWSDVHKMNPFFMSRQYDRNSLISYWNMDKRAI